MAAAAAMPEAAFAEAAVTVGDHSSCCSRVARVYGTVQLCCATRLGRWRAQADGTWRNGKTHRDVAAGAGIRAVPGLFVIPLQFDFTNDSFESVNPRGLMTGVGRRRPVEPRRAVDINVSESLSAKASGHRPLRCSRSSPWIG